MGSRLQLAPGNDSASGDGDFRSLVEALQRRGVRVTVVSSNACQQAMIADERVGKPTSSSCCASWNYELDAMVSAFERVGTRSIRQASPVALASQNAPMWPTCVQ